MAENSGVSRGKISRQNCSEDEPAVKKLKTDYKPTYPVDTIETEDGINDVEQEIELLENANSTIKCGNCGRDVVVKDSQGRSPNIIHHFIYGDSSPHCPKHHILKLMCYAEGAASSHVAAVRICQRWWTVEEMLSSDNPRRDGVMMVSTFGERIVLSLLNRVLFRYQEHVRGEVTFLSHPPKEMAKLLWISGKAVGFYTIKQKGKLINDYSPLPWAMNVLDTIFVRKNYRHQGLATRMVEDFLSSFPKQDLGFSQPLAEPCKELCYKLLLRRKDDRARLWECAEPATPHYRANLWLDFQSSRASKAKTVPARDK